MSARLQERSAEPSGKIKTAFGIVVIVVLAGIGGYVLRAGHESTGEPDSRGLDDAEGTRGAVTSPDLLRSPIARPSDGNERALPKRGVYEHHYLIHEKVGSWGPQSRFVQLTFDGAASLARWKPDWLESLDFYISGGVAPGLSGEPDYTLILSFGVRYNVDGIQDGYSWFGDSTRQMYWLAGGQRFVLDSKSSLANPDLHSYAEEVKASISIEDFLKALRFDQSVIRVGDCEFILGHEEMTALKDFASRLRADD